MKNIIISILVTVVCLFASCSKEEPLIAEVKTGIAGDDLLIPNAQKILDKNSLPGIAGMTMSEGKIVEKVELGVQSLENDAPILENSKWHIGSITKSMTATLAAILIEAGYMQWDTKISDITTDGYLAEYQDVTLYDLLSMSAGITGEDYPVDPEDTRHTSEIRLEWAIAALNEPQNTINEFAYSNSSFVIAGVMMELIMEKTWEELMITYLFEPLEMDGAGFGVPGKNGELDQPWGHRRSGNSWDAKDPTSKFSDNPASLGPAGTIHITLSDIANYANLHLGKTNLLQTQTLEVLHTEVNNSGYALGWLVNENGIFHSGSNANWYAQLFINLEQDFVNFSVTNSYDKDLHISVPAVQRMLGILGQRIENSL